jgi:F-type H+-transporting ATPase subunit a
MFTLLHALIQAYVLTMLCSLFYGQVSDNTPKPPKEKKQKRKDRAERKDGKKRQTVVKDEAAA